MIIDDAAGKLVVTKSQSFFFPSILINKRDHFLRKKWIRDFRELNGFNCFKRNQDLFAHFQTPKANVELWKQQTLIGEFEFLSLLLGDGDEHL